VTALALNAISYSAGPTAREPIGRTALEAAITAAVKRSSPSCEPFVGILVERIGRSSSDETNWAVKGVKFGSQSASSATPRYPSSSSG
jgi:hypothetical protein